jgi:CRP-like cAMP-binding protein
MFEIFENYLSERVTLGVEDVNLVRSLSIEKKIAKRQFILREGEPADHTNFVVKGLLRLYRTDFKGEEYILKFANENHWINDRQSYLTGLPAIANIEAIENSAVLSWKKADFDYLLKEIPCFKQLMKDLSAKNQVANQDRVYNSISLSSEEKYNLFIEKNATISNRIPLHMIASYLGVTRETLSRIRRQNVGK